LITHTLQMHTYECRIYRDCRWRLYIACVTPCEGCSWEMHPHMVRCADRSGLTQKEATRYYGHDGS
jgi:hypothetical protein